MTTTSSSFTSFFISSPICAPASLVFFVYTSALFSVSNFLLNIIFFFHPPQISSRLVPVPRTPSSSLSPLRVMAYLITSAVNTIDEESVLIAEPSF